MIVRCSNCSSAFAVDDDKVMNKRFAFTCPKCDNENIFDNRRQKKQDFTGGAVVDEAYKDAESRIARGRDMSEETAVGMDREDFMAEPAVSKSADRAGARERNRTDDSLMDEPIALDDDLSGLAEPERLDETSPVLESSELPPADDMRPDLPLDDLVLDDELKDLDMPDIDLDDGSEGKNPKTAAQDSDILDFEELGDIPEFKSKSGAIRDEMEPRDAGEPVELDEIDDIDKILEEDSKEKEIVDDFEPLEEETVTKQRAEAGDVELGEEIKTEEMYRADDVQEDESITIDLDTLDIDLEGDDGTIKKKPVAVAKGKPGSQMVEDENITIDLDTLDIDLQEGGEVSKGEGHEDLDLDISDFSEETIQELESRPQKAGKDDDDITLDLNSLDISLEETGEIQKGEAVDEDEKLTLDDAGLTLEELSPADMSRAALSSEKLADDEDIKLRIDDIDPNLDMHTIEKELQEAESILSEERVKDDDIFIDDDLSDLPEIDFDEEFNRADKHASAARVSRRDDDLMSIDERGKVPVRKGGLQKEIPDMVPKGAVNFSIDYSIKYSRIGAVLRLMALFFIGLIPHYVVFFIYNILSLILGFINYLVVLFSGKSVEDFSGIHENTLRYLLSISASGLGIVEEMPVFAGRDNIDYPLQMRIVYPLHSSKILAFLRLTGIGIILILLPHLLILGLMSLAVPLVFLIGEFSVLITGGWPHMLFDFMLRYYRYTARVMAFCIGIIDQYPRFKFD